MDQRRPASRIEPALRRVFNAVHTLTVACSATGADLLLAVPDAITHVGVI